MVVRTYFRQKETTRVEKVKEVNVYIVTTIKSSQKKNGYVGYCLEYYPQGRKYPETLIDYEPIEGMTNKQAELESLIRALKRMRQKCNLSIYTESTYINMGLGEPKNVDKWIKSGWITGKNVAVKNKEQWTQILKLLIGSTYKILLKEPNAYVKKLQKEADRRDKNRNSGEINA